MEVLFQFGDSKRLLNPTSADSLAQLIVEELSKFDPSALILEPGCSSTKSSLRGNNYYLVQKWSTKWNDFVDLLDLNEVEDGDKLTAIPRPAVVSKSAVVVVIALSWY